MAFLGKKVARRKPFSYKTKRRNLWQNLIKSKSIKGECDSLPLSLMTRSSRPKFRVEISVNSLVNNWAKPG
uniref:Ribosomal protein L32 n=1 Tax=Romanomermis culicivorax TaxID=13658 RepID=A0A915JD39_ROMCU